MWQFILSIIHGATNEWGQCFNCIWGLNLPTAVVFYSIQKFPLKGPVSNRPKAATRQFFFSYMSWVISVDFQKIINFRFIPSLIMKKKSNFSQYSKIRSTHAVRKKTKCHREIMMGWYRPSLGQRKLALSSDSVLPWADFEIWTSEMLDPTGWCLY